MNSYRPLKAYIAAFTVIVFLVTNIVWMPDGFAAASAPLRGAGGVSEVSLPYRAALDQSLHFAIPQELGKVDDYKAGQGPMIVHLQDAHGHYEGQQKIRQLLNHLNKTYGIGTVLVEGSAFELDPEKIHYFPKDMKKTLAVNEEFTRHAWISGAELSLLETPSLKALGIEEAKSYRENGQSFVKVLTQKEKTAQFLVQMNLQIERLASHYLNKDLRNFLRRVELFEKNQIPFDAWLAQLKGEAEKNLEIDLASPAYQLDWPMLVRLFKVQELSSKLDRRVFPGEREKFLKAIGHFMPSIVHSPQTLDKKPWTVDRGPSTYAQVEALLKSETQSQQLPDPETELLFEDMVRQLPKDFDYNAFPNVRYFIGTLLLRSELKADLLMQEVERLSGAIAEKLIRNKEEKKLVALLADHRLLQKLFALELLPADYDRILSRKNELKPSEIIKKFSLVDRPQTTAKTKPWTVDRGPRTVDSTNVKRVKDIRFKHVEELDALYESAMQFYAGVKTRDGAMIQRIEERLKETGATKAVLITGGFHSQPIRDHFITRNYTYALVTPELSGADETGHANYIQAALASILPAKETYKNPAAFTTNNPAGDNTSIAPLRGPITGKLRKMEASGVLTRAEVRTVIEKLSGRAETRQDGVEEDFGKPHFPKGGKRFVFLEDPARQKKDLEYWRSHGQEAFYEDVDQAIKISRPAGFLKFFSVITAFLISLSAQAQLIGMWFTNAFEQFGPTSLWTQVAIESLTNQEVYLEADLSAFDLMTSSNTVLGRIYDSLVNPWEQIPAVIVINALTNQLETYRLQYNASIPPTNLIYGAWGYGAPSGQDAPSGSIVSNELVINFPGPTNGTIYAERVVIPYIHGDAYSKIAVRLKATAGARFMIVTLDGSSTYHLFFVTGTGDWARYPLELEPGRSVVRIVAARYKDGGTADPVPDGDLPATLQISHILPIPRSGVAPTSKNVNFPRARALKSRSETRNVTQRRENGGQEQALRVLSIKERLRARRVENNHVMFLALLSSHPVIHGIAQKFFDLQWRRAETREGQVSVLPESRVPEQSERTIFYFPEGNFVGYEGKKVSVFLRAKGILEEQLQNAEIQVVPVGSSEAVSVFIGDEEEATSPFAALDTLLGQSGIHVAGEISTLQAVQLRSGARALDAAGQARGLDQKKIEKIAEEFRIRIEHLIAVANEDPSKAGAEASQIAGVLSSAAFSDQFEAVGNALVSVISDGEEKDAVRARAIKDLAQLAIEIGQLAALYSSGRQGVFPPVPALSKMADDIRSVLTNSYLTDASLAAILRNETAKVTEALGPRSEARQKQTTDQRPQTPANGLSLQSQGSSLQSEKVRSEARVHTSAVEFQAVSAFLNAFLHDKKFREGYEGIKVSDGRPLGEDGMEYRFTMPEMDEPMNPEKFLSLLLQRAGIDKDPEIQRVFSIKPSSKARFTPAILMQVVMQFFPDLLRQGEDDVRYQNGEMYIVTAYTGESRAASPDRVDYELLIMDSPNRSSTRKALAGRIYNREVIVDRDLVQPILKEYYYGEPSGSQELLDALKDYTVPPDMLQDIFSTRVLPPNIWRWGWEAEWDRYSYPPSFKKAGVYQARARKILDLFVEKNPEIFNDQLLQAAVQKSPQSDFFIGFFARARGVPEESIAKIAEKFRSEARGEKQTTDQRLRTPAEDFSVQSEKIRAEARKEVILNAEDNAYDFVAGTAGIRELDVNGFTLNNAGVAGIAFIQDMKEHFDREGKKGKRRLVVAYDARPGHREYAQRAFLAALPVARESGIELLFVDQVVPVFTPMELTQADAPEALRADAVLFWTASHNPIRGYNKQDALGAYRGAKILVGGTPLPKKDWAPVTAKAKAIQSYRLASESDADARPAQVDWVGYSVDRIKKTIDWDALVAGLIAYKKDHPGFRVVIDAMHGSTAPVSARLYDDARLRDAGILLEVRRTTTMDKEHPESMIDLATGRPLKDGKDREISWAPDPTTPSAVGELPSVVKEDGVVFLLSDGDGDRMVAYESGEEIKPNPLGAAFADYTMTQGWVNGTAIVRTAPTSHFYDLVAKLHGLPVIKTAVGSGNFAGPLSRGEMAGGFEESGHIAVWIKKNLFFDNSVMEGVLLLQMIAAKGMPFRNIVTELWGRVTAATGVPRLYDIRTAMPTERVTDAVKSASKKVNADPKWREIFGEELARRLGKTLLKDSPLFPTFELEDEGGLRVNFSDFSSASGRGSGTEPIYREYAEAPAGQRSNEEESFRIAKIYGDTVEWTALQMELEGVLKQMGDLNARIRQIKDPKTDKEYPALQKSYRNLDRRNVEILQALFAMNRTIRSEARLTDAQEKQFQKAMKNLQPGWLDRLHVKGALHRKTVAIKALSELGDSRAVPILIEELSKPSIKPLSFRDLIPYSIKLLIFGDFGMFDQSFLKYEVQKDEAVKKALIEIGISALPDLLEALKPKDPEVITSYPGKYVVQQISEIVSEIFQRIHDPKTTPFLKEILQSMPTEISYYEMVNTGELEFEGAADNSGHYKYTDVIKTMSNSAYEVLKNKIEQEVQENPQVSEPATSLNPTNQVPKTKDNRSETRTGEIKKMLDDFFQVIEANGSKLDPTLYGAILDSEEDLKKGDPAPNVIANLVSLYAETGKDSPFIGLIREAGPEVTEAFRRLYRTALQDPVLRKAFLDWEILSAQVLDAVQQVAAIFHLNRRAETRLQPVSEEEIQAMAKDLEDWRRRQKLEIDPTTLGNVLFNIAQDARRQDTRREEALVRFHTFDKEAIEEAREIESLIRVEVNRLLGANLEELDDAEASDYRDRLDELSEAWHHYYMHSTLSSLPNRGKGWSLPVLVAGASAFLLLLLAAEIYLLGLAENSKVSLPVPVIQQDEGVRLEFPVPFGDTNSWVTYNAKVVTEKGVAKINFSPDGKPEGAGAALKLSLPSGSGPYGSVVIEFEAKKIVSKDPASILVIFEDKNGNVLGVNQVPIDEGLQSREIQGNGYLWPEKLAALRMVVPPTEFLDPEESSISAISNVKSLSIRSISLKRSDGRAEIRSQRELRNTFLEFAGTLKQLSEDAVREELASIVELEKETPVSSQRSHAAALLAAYDRERAIETILAFHSRRVSETSERIDAARTIEKEFSRLVMDLQHSSFKTLEAELKFIADLENERGIPHAKRSLAANLLEAKADSGNYAEGDIAFQRRLIIKTIAAFYHQSNETYLAHMSEETAHRIAVYQAHGAGIIATISAPSSSRRAEVRAIIAVAVGLMIAGVVLVRGVWHWYIGYKIRQLREQLEWLQYMRALEIVALDALRENFNIPSELLHELGRLANLKPRKKDWQAYEDARRELNKIIVSAGISVEAAPKADLSRRSTAPLGLLFEKIASDGSPGDRMILPPISKLSESSAVSSESVELFRPDPAAIPNARLQRVLRRAETRSTDSMLKDIERDLLWRHGFSQELLREQAENLEKGNADAVGKILNAPHLSTIYIHIVNRLGYDIQALAPEDLKALAALLQALAGQMDKTVAAAAKRLAQILTAGEVERLGAIALSQGFFWPSFLLWNKADAAHQLEKVFREIGLYDQSPWLPFLGERFLRKTEAGEFLSEVAKAMPASRFVGHAARLPSFGIRSETRKPSEIAPTVSQEHLDQVLTELIEKNSRAGEMMLNEDILAAEAGIEWISSEQLAKTVARYNISNDKPFMLIQMVSEGSNIWIHPRLGTAGVTESGLDRALAALVEENSVAGEMMLNEEALAEKAGVEKITDEQLAKTVARYNASPGASFSLFWTVSEGANIWIQPRTVVASAPEPVVVRSETRDIETEVHELEKWRKAEVISSGDLKAALDILYKQALGEDLPAMTASMKKTVADLQKKVDELILGEGKGLKSLDSDGASHYRDNLNRLKNAWSFFVRIKAESRSEAVQPGSTFQMQAIKAGLRIFLETRGIFSFTSEGDSAAISIPDLPEQGERRPLRSEPDRANVEKAEEAFQVFLRQIADRYEGIVSKTHVLENEGEDNENPVKGVTLVTLTLTPRRSEDRVQEVVDQLPPERIIVQEEFRFGIIAELILAKIRGLGKRAEIVLAKFFGTPAYAEGINMPGKVEEKLTEVSKSVEFVASAPKLDVARSMILNREVTGKVADGIVMSARFAFDEVGGIGVARTALRETPVVVLSPDAKQRSYILAMNVKLAAAKRLPILIAETPEEASQALIKAGAKRHQAYLGKSEENGALAVMLSRLFKDIQFYNDVTFLNSFGEYLGGEITRILEQVRTQFAVARAA